MLDRGGVSALVDQGGRCVRPGGRRDSASGPMGTLC